MTESQSYFSPINPTLTLPLLLCYLIISFPFLSPIPSPFLPRSSGPVRGVGGPSPALMGGMPAPMMMPPRGPPGMPMPMMPPPGTSNVQRWYRHSITLVTLLVTVTHPHFFLLFSIFSCHCCGCYGCYGCFAILTVAAAMVSPLLYLFLLLLLLLLL